jgi:hypothetical protein
MHIPWTGANDGISPTSGGALRFMLKQVARQPKAVVESQQGTGGQEGGQIRGCQLPHGLG